MKDFIILLLVIQHAIFYFANGQVSDDFTDGDFTENPAWSGDLSHFMINTDGQLQLNAPPEAGQSYLATTSEIIDNAEWTFHVKLEFNPSSSNYIDIYLVSDVANLSGPVYGYFLRVGNSQD